MKMETEGNVVKIHLGREDTYEGHEQNQNGSSLHKFMCGIYPLVMIKHHGQIFRVFTHENYELDQRTNGDLIAQPPIEVWGKRHRDGVPLREARMPVPYTPLTRMNAGGTHVWR